MNCSQALERMLEADPEALRGTSDAALARHLDQCARCRAQAALILEETDALREALDAARPRPAPVPTAGANAPPRPSAVGGLWRVALPLGLAAGLAVVLLGRRRALPTPSATTATQINAAPLDVRAAPGRTVAVFHTDNPNIVIIWSF